MKLQNLNLDNIKPGTIWISGVTSSGKTTLAEMLVSDLKKQSINNIKLLDGDKFRSSLPVKYGNDIKSRYKILRKIIENAILLNRQGILVIVATVSHKLDMRLEARTKIKHFMEVELVCNHKICANRDYKGLYKKAYNKEFDIFPGVTEDYENNELAELTLNTGDLSKEVCFDKLLNSTITFLSKHNK